jgi:hypothetical protein
MIKGSNLLIPVIMVLSITGCVKGTYNMNMLSKQTHLSPTLAISAVKGDISFSDIAKASDTVVFDQNKFVTLVFKKDSVVNLQLSDFSKGIIVQKTATIKPTAFDLNINDILSHITGDFKIMNPLIKFNYSNSFPDSVKLNLNVTGHRGNKSVNLNLAPFTLTGPNFPAQQEISASYIIDKTNSSLQDMISLPPESINISGTAVVNYSAKDNKIASNVLVNNHITGSIEVDMPLDLAINNLQFTDTVDNFISDKNNSNNDPVNPEDFQFLRIILTAKNGFPLGASLKMSLYDSGTHFIKNTVNASTILKPATVDSNGKAVIPTESTTTIEFTSDFFSMVNKADKIIFIFTFNTSGNGSQDVKIYSDYRINFNAALVVKPDINLN